MEFTGKNQPSASLEYVAEETFQDIGLEEPETSTVIQVFDVTIAPVPACEAFSTTTQQR